MGDLNCRMSNCLTRKALDERIPAASNYDGQLRCRACTEAYLEPTRKTLEQAIEYLEQAKGVCDRCSLPSELVQSVLGYDKLCSRCLNRITSDYTYVEFMVATNGTGNARLLPNG